jgi:hypothetical protein
MRNKNIFKEKIAKIPPIFIGFDLEIQVFSHGCY